MIILGLFCDYFKCYSVNNWCNIGVNSGKIRVTLGLYWGAESESNGGSRRRVWGLQPQALGFGVSFVQAEGWF